MAPLLVLSPLSYQGLDCCPRPLGRAPLPWGGFLILSPVGILGWRMLSCDVRCEVFSSNPDLSPLDASSTPSPGGTIKNVSIHCPCPPAAANSTTVATPCFRAALPGPRHRPPEAFAPDQASSHTPRGQPSSLLLGTAGVMGSPLG